MIETIFENDELKSMPFNRIDSVIISEDPIVIDLFFLDEVNALVLKDFKVFECLPNSPFQDYVEIKTQDDFVKMNEYSVTEPFKDLLSELLSALNTEVIGVQFTGALQTMCPSYHVDKLPLRLVQCVDGLGTTLKTSSGKIIETLKNDLILLKGELWQSKCGAISHKSPDTLEPRSLFRIDFLD